MAPQPPLKPPNAKQFWLALFALFGLSIGVLLVVPKLVHPLVPANAILFRETPGGWVKLPPLAGRAEQILISDGGTVWVQTSYQDMISRLDGTSWHAFSPSGSRAKSTSLYGNLALDGEGLWGATGEGVIHFDGARWWRYRPTVATEHPTSIAAAHGQVWMIDHVGNLSHFDGRVWTAHKLDLPGVSWSDRIGVFRVPVLALTSDGSLWLAWDGLWRFDGATWTRKIEAARRPDLIGTALDAVWVKEGDDLVDVSMDGARQARHTPGDMGLSVSPGVWNVAGRAGQAVFTTNLGLLRFDGRQWNAPVHPGLGIAVFSGVAVAPDGSAWGIGYPPPPARSRRLTATFLLAVGGLITLIAMIVLPARFMLQQSRYHEQAIREALEHGTGSQPVGPQPVEPAKLFGPKSAGWIIALGVIASIGGYFVMRKYFPDAPAWWLLVFYLVVHVAATLKQSLKKRKPLPSDPIGPGGPPRYEWKKSILAIAGGLAVLALLNFDFVARFLGLKGVGALLTVGIAVAGYVAFQIYDYYRNTRVERAIEQCRYQDAVAVLDGPLRWPATGLWKLTRADALFYAGRLREAEPLVREVIGTDRNPVGKALALERLGLILIEDNRFDDATRAFEAAVKLLPVHSAAYNGLAEVRLRRGAEPEKALEYAEQALERQRASLVQRKSARERFGSIRGNQAWALAILGRSTEAQEAIDAGLRETAPKHKPELAGFYWRAGMAMAALYNSTAASAHFRKAAELDPQGYYGGLAAWNLREHSVWGAAGIPVGGNPQR